MSQIPVDEITAHGYEPPTNKQFSVFLANRVGRLLELLEIFEGHALELSAMSVVDSADHAVVRILTSRSDLARRILDRKKLPFSEYDVLVVQVDELHTLSMMCAALLGAEINIQYAYPLMVRPHRKSAIALHCEDYVLSGQILRRRGFCLLAENDLGENLNPGNSNNIE